MNIFVYSDESGVFDQVHNDYFVFGGLLFLSKEQRDICSRMYSKAERDIRNSNNYDSKDKILIRAADIVANKVYYKAITDSVSELKSHNNLFIKYLPRSIQD